MISSNSELLPLDSLQSGSWFKLIGGASHHHVPSIYFLAAAYALAGADCIDVAADQAIVTAARDGINWAAEKALAWGQRVNLPWLMISINDGEDPHFRKAELEPAGCLTGCSQPCVGICPAAAISFSQFSLEESNGVSESRCYGCGRCLPVCPINHIRTRSYISSPGAIAAQLFPQVDALEIHTQTGRADSFERLWRAIRPWLHHLRAVSISCPDGPDSIQHLWQLYEVIRSAQIPIIWQTDGRPMSGDIGVGTTHATIRYAQKVMATGPPGFVQLAGGTNFHTVPRLRELSLLDNLPDRRCIAGVAYGSYARTRLMTPLNQLDAFLNADFGAFDKSSRLTPCSSVGDHPAVDGLLRESVVLAEELTKQIKN